MQRPTALLTAVAALVLWFVFCLYLYPPRIEGALLDDSVAALAGAGIAGVRPEVDGRDVVLLGTVASAESRAQAEHLVAGVTGVIAVDNQLEIAAAAPEPPPLYLEIRSRPEGVLLRGSVPTTTEREELLTRARDLYGADRVEDQTVVDAAVEGGAALASAAGVLGVLAGTRQTLQARLDGDSLRLSGTVSSPEARRRIEEQARAAAPLVRLFFSTLLVDAPPEPPIKEPDPPAAGDAVE